jgi:hypothetical protein
MENAKDKNTMITAYCAGEQSLSVSTCSGGTMVGQDVNGAAPMLANFISYNHPDSYKFDRDLAFCGPGVFPSQMSRYGIYDGEYSHFDDYIDMTVSFVTGGAWMIGWYILDPVLDNYSWTNAEFRVADMGFDDLNSEGVEYTIHIKPPTVDDAKIVVPAYSDTTMIGESGGGGMRNFRVTASFNSDTRRAI